MLKGDRERADSTHKEVLGELSAEMALASELRTELLAVREQQPLSSGPQDAWLDAITKAVREATMPLMDHIENKTNEVILSIPRRQSHRLPPLADVDWQSEVCTPPPYLRGKVEVKDTHRRGITIHQLSFLGSFVKEVLDTVEIRDPHPGSNADRITWRNVNLYHINDLFVVPLTDQFECSFVELLADGPQDPLWFISHWWGCPFMDSLSMLTFHASAHDLPQDVPYWMCTFANNQHNLEELDEHLMQTPFARAIMSETCQGTIMLMNETAEPFKRTWCTLENFISTTCAKEKTQPPHYKLEVAAIIQQGAQMVEDQGHRMNIPRSSALLIDDGSGNLKDHVEIGGAWFPGNVARSGVKADISKADASNEEDKQSILRLIIGAHPNEMPEPPLQHDRYDTVNHAIHRVFGPRALYDAAQDGDVDEVNDILSRGISMADVKNARSETPLWIAVYNNHLAVVRLLLDKGANANMANGCGNTPLQAAVAREAVESLTVLLEAHADVNQSDAQGFTPMHVASQECFQDVAKLLLHARAHPDSANLVGNTSLHISAERDHSDIVFLLLRWRADPDKQNKKGHTPLMVAAQHDGLTSLECLLTDGQANPNQGDDPYGTPLSWAAYHGNLGAVTRLLQCRADVNTIFKSEADDTASETALDSANNRGNDKDNEIIEILQRAGGLCADELANLGAE